MCTDVRVVWCVASALVVLAAAPARGQGARSLSLDEAIAQAVAQAPRLVEARARVASASAAVTARVADGRPAVTALAGVVRTNHVDEFGIRQQDGTVRVLFPDIPTNYRTRAEVALPVYTAGRLEARLEAARADRDAADADVRATAADIELATATAYWTLVTARTRTSVLVRARDRADRVVADVEARVAAGLVPPNEALSARAERARQRVLVIQADHDATSAEAELARLVGWELGTRIEPTTPVSRATPGVEVLAGESPVTLAARASRERPERLALTLRAEALRASASALVAAARPTVGVVASVEPGRPHPRFVPRSDQWHTGWDAGISVSWAIFDGGRSRAERAAVLSQAEALASRVEDFDRSVAVDLRQRLSEMASIRAAIEAATEMVDAATEARRVVGERFAAGVITTSDVIESDVVLLQAELERTRLQVALRVAEARLLRAVGAK